MRTGLLTLRLVVDLSLAAHGAQSFRCSASDWRRSAGDPATHSIDWRWAWCRGIGNCR